jgi:hypothetical protein
MRIEEKDMTTTDTSIDLSAWSLSFESSADWRRKRAKEHPEDAARNLDAAAELDSLAAQFNAGDVDPDLVRQYEALGEDDDLAHKAVEVEGEMMRETGFSSSYEKADDFVREIISRVRR